MAVLAAVAFVIAAGLPIEATAKKGGEPAAQAQGGGEPEANRGRQALRGGTRARSTAGAPRTGSTRGRRALRRAAPGGPRNRPASVVRAQTVAPAAAPAAAPAPARARASQRAARARRAARRRAAARARRARTDAPARTAAPAPSPGPAAAAAATPVDAGRGSAVDARTTGVDDRDQRSIVTRTVESIRQVIPDWAWALIAALVALLALTAAIAGTAAARERRARRQRARLLEQVGLLQSALLPDVPGEVGVLAATVAYRPAEGLAAGGDFYDVFAIDDNRVGIVVGDVAGHGRDALGAATFIRHMVRSYLEAGLVPRAALQLAGQVLDDQRREDFATVVAAVHDRRAATLSYATAGHPPPIILGPARYEPLVVASSPPLGVGWPTGQRQTTIPFPAGATACFYTDGLTEARRGNEMLGHPRLEELVADLGPRPDVGDLLARVRREADDVSDDMAAVTIHAREGAASSLVPVEEVEVTLPELHGARLERFLRACGVPREDIARAIRAAAPRVVRYGSVVLRVRLADERSGVDVLPVETPAPAAELASLRRP